MTEHPLELFVVYDHPTDFPNSYVVRRTQVIDGVPVLDKEPLLVGQDLEMIRFSLERRHLSNIGRCRDDDPVILEVWI